MDMNKVATYIEAYLRDYKNYKDHWNYEDGCVLIGSMFLYQVTGDKPIRNHHSLHGGLC